jgi:Glycosyl transferase family 2
MQIETVNAVRLGSFSVAILLATYNGEEYLDAQIQSLFAQSHADILVLARDDHSTDRTPEILARWAASRPDKFRLLSDSDGRLGLARNFSRLMEACDAPYFAFCDQDDVWLPEKLELLLKEMQKIESRSRESTPILVHSDLMVVDKELRTISPSLFEYLHVNPRKGRRLEQLVCNNIVIGCALMGNRALLELARPIPAAWPFHDWWVALIASSCGVLRTIPEPTILYRQHGGNQVGAGLRHGRSTLWDARYILQQPRKLKSRLANAASIVQSQASVLLSFADRRMSRRNRQFLLAFSLPLRGDEVASLSWARRVWLRLRFSMIYARSLHRLLRWCF